MKQLLLSLWETETIIPVLLEIEEETEITSLYKVRLLGVVFENAPVIPLHPHLLFENMLNISLSLSHTHTHAHTHTHMQTHTQDTHTYTHTHSHAQNTHTHAHTCTHAHTHTHTHTHTQISTALVILSPSTKQSCYCPFVHTLESAQPCTHLNCS